MTGVPRSSARGFETPASGEVAGSFGLAGIAIIWDRIETPLGPLLIAATRRGLVRVAFAGKDCGSEPERLVGESELAVTRDPVTLEPAGRQIEEYFSGSRRRFDLPLDLSMLRGFRFAVLRRLLAIPYGTTTSYGAVAATIGSPGAARAAGSACAANPLPVVVPCHRVVRSGGKLGGYAGGTEAKRALIELEMGFAISRSCEPASRRQAPVARYVQPQH